MAKTDKLQRKLLESDTWDKFVTEHPQGHPFQLSGWGELKRTVGWDYKLVGYFEGEKLVTGAMVLFLPAPVIGKKLAYVPRGPLMTPDDSRRDYVLDDLTSLAEGEGAFYLKLEPSWLLGSSKLPRPWRRSKETIIHEKTFITDLSGPDGSEVTARLSQKARRLARKAGRDGVEVSKVTSSDELEVVYELYEETAMRAGFSIHPKRYHEDCFRLLGDANEVLLAKREGRPIAFLWGAHTDAVGVYLYGGSNDEARKYNANYLLQMELINLYHSYGVATYDLNGALPGGVTAFKSTFATEEVDWVGALDRPINKALYSTWSKANPILKPLARRIKQFKQSS